jgi:hypothetical protein
MSSPSAVYEDEYPDYPREIPEVVLLDTNSDIYGNKTYHFNVDCLLHRLHSDGTCEIPVYDKDEISRWKRCPIPKLLTAFLLKLL